MDPETERHFAALIMEEAARLRRQAEKEGVHAYLAKPKVRGKPNPQFFKATVRSIAQANRAAEVSGMWKRRARELELEERENKKGQHRHKSDLGGRHRDEVSRYHYGQSKCAPINLNTERRESNELIHSPMSHSTAVTGCRLDDSSNALPDGEEVDHRQEFEDQGLKEEEIELFLQSRIKRGRGAVGSRMDETGPYPSAHSKLEDALDVRVKEDWEQRILGPSREVFERHLALEPKMHTKNSRLKSGEEEDGRKGTIMQKVKKKEKKHKKKHRHSHKKSKKADDL